MVDKKLAEWIEGKLDGGVEPERLRNALESTGRDPSAVDEVMDPFREDSYEEGYEEDEALNTSDGDAETGEAPGSRFSAPEIHSLNVPWKALGVAAVALLVLAGIGYGLSEFGLPISDRDSSGVPSECPDVGVRVNSVSVDGGSTYANVKVTRGSADVVLELYGSGRMLDSKNMRFGGSKKVVFNAAGDKVVIYPAGCSEFSDSMGVR